MLGRKTDAGGISDSTATPTVYHSSSVHTLSHHVNAHPKPLQMHQYEAISLFYSSHTFHSHCITLTRTRTLLRIYQDSNSITQSELMRTMNDNSKDEEIQVGNYSSYIPTESVHGPRHAQDMWSCAWTKVTVCVKWRLVCESVTVIMWSKIGFLTLPPF